MTIAAVGFCTSTMSGDVPIGPVQEGYHCADTNDDCGALRICYYLGQGCNYCTGWQNNRFECQYGGQANCQNTIDLDGCGWWMQAQCQGDYDPGACVDIGLDKPCPKFSCLGLPQQ